MAEEKKQVVLTGQQLLNAYRNEEAKLQALQQRSQQLNMLFIEAGTAEEAVKEIKKASKNEKVIVDLGAGICVEAMLDGNEKFKTGFAGGILINADSEAALAYLKKQKETLQKEIEIAAKEQERAAMSMNEISNVLRVGEQEARNENLKAQKAKND
ncbi:MAG: prefoldin subunit alpha [Candidatus ainarchaeum sp.]|nr:prefoldin subunit alpha [Candidatus ainarchaeum sp.]